MAVAIATGPAVAQGHSPIKIKLSNRVDRKRLAVVLDEEVGQQGDKELGDKELGDKELGDEELGDKGLGDKEMGDREMVEVIPTVRNIDIVAVPSEPKRAPILPSTTTTNNIPNLPFCTSSQSLSVAKGGPNTEAFASVMSSYGTMMGQMAKGMLEGVGPQLMNMLQVCQVDI